MLECAVVELDCELAGPDELNRLEENVKLQNFYLEHGSAESLMGIKLIAAEVNLRQMPRLLWVVAADRIQNLGMILLKTGACF